MPTTASMPFASRSSTSACVVMPPAAESRRPVAARMASDGRHVHPLHEPFVVHVGVEELVAVGLERLHRFDGCHGEGGAPAVDDEPAAAGVHRGNHLLAPDRVADFPGERDVHVPFLEERRTEDDLLRARLDHLPGALDRSDAAADAARELGRHPADQVVVVARGHGGIEVDELDDREVLEAPDPPEDVGAFDGDPVTLDELDNLAAFEVDTGDQHCANAVLSCQLSESADRTGTPA